MDHFSIIYTQEVYVAIVHLKTICELEVDCISISVDVVSVCFMRIWPHASCTNPGMASLSLCSSKVSPQHTHTQTSTNPFQFFMFLHTSFPKPLETARTYYSSCHPVLPFLQQSIPFPKRSSFPAPRGIEVHVTPKALGEGQMVKTSKTPTNKDPCSVVINFEHSTQNMS